MMTEKTDYYETLGVSRDAPVDEIKRAYRRLAKQHHPDVNNHDPDAETKFKTVNEAYQVLSDADKRAQYDRYGHGAFEQGGGGGTGGFGDFGGFGDVFDLFFGGGQGQSGGSGQMDQRGDDLRYDVELTLEEAAVGVSRTISYSRMQMCLDCAGSGAAPGSQPVPCVVCGGAGQVRQQQQTLFGTQIRVTHCPRCAGTGKIISSPCPKCDGNGRFRDTVERKIDIPAGVDTGMKIRMHGEGDSGPRGGSRGDLYVVTHIAKHDVFVRKGDDLWCEIGVSFPLASLGGVVDVQVIGGSADLAVHAGTQTGEVYCLRGHGMPDVRGRGKGDLNVMIKVKTPTKLNDEQKTLLRQLAESAGEEIREAKGKGLFERVKNAFGGL